MELLLRAKEWMRNLKNSVCVCVCVKLTQAWVSLQRGALVVDKGVPKLGETPPPPPAQPGPALSLPVATSSPPRSFLCLKLPAGSEPALPSKRPN